MTKKSFPAKVTVTGILISGTLFLSSCATVPPSGMGTASPTESVSVIQPSQSELSPPSQSVTPSDSPSPIESQTPSASVTPSVSSTPSESVKPRVELTGNGINTYNSEADKADGRFALAFAFGAAQEQVEKILNKAFGEPKESAGILCELDSTSPYSSVSRYGALSVTYTAKNRSKKSARTLASWAYDVSTPLPSILSVAGDPPLNATFKQLKKKYPKGTLEETGLGEESYTFTLPSKLRFIGDGSPDLIQAGLVVYCD